MNKSKLMVEHKELYGGLYVRNNGRWYWKSSHESSEEVGPISGFWLMQRIHEAKNKKPVAIEFAKLPPEPAKVEEVKKEEPVAVEEVKTEVTQQKPKKSAPKVKKEITENGTTSI
jgi:hypothetical protein